MQKQLNLKVKFRESFRPFAPSALRERAGDMQTLPLATWIRPCVTKVSTLEPAPLPGTHTIPVLREHGFTDNEIATLVDESVAFTGWKLLKHYLPS